MGIYDAMMLCRADVQTYCFGLAASMGAFLLGAGKKGKRHRYGCGHVKRPSGTQMLFYVQAVIPYRPSSKHPAALALALSLKHCAFLCIGLPTGYGMSPLPPSAFHLKACHYTLLTHTPSLSSSLYLHLPISIMPFISIMIHQSLTLPLFLLTHQHIVCIHFCIFCFVSAACPTAAS
jgi:hypothetical protein